MTCSPARLAANRRNAQRSTGPRTTEGKAVARLNAFRHGQAGAGDLLAPGEDPAAVARRAAAFGAELGAEGEVGLTLAHRAALLSVRMERAADRDEASVAAGVAAARDEFDREVADELDRLIATLEAGDDPAETIAGLAAIPAGVDHLVAAWRTLGRSVAAGDGVAAGRARTWLGGDDRAEAGGDLGVRIDAEVGRLVAAMADVGRAMTRARHEAGVLASFDPSPAATLARRYEAAAERGMYRALRAIADHRRDRAANMGFDPTRPVARPTPSAPSAPSAPTPRATTAAASATTVPAAPGSLGSFRAGVDTGPPRPARPLDLTGEPPLEPVPARKVRPDLARVLKKRR